MRARPPQVIRNSMVEIGMGSLANFDLLAKAGTVNTDAARAYFPVLDPNIKAKAVPLSPAEKKLVKLSQDIQLSLRQSPPSVRFWKQRPTEGLPAEMLRLKKFFRTDTATDDDNIPNESLWDGDKCWILPETLPGELLPQQLRKAQTSPQRKRLKKSSDRDGIPQSVFSKADMRDDADQREATNQDPAEDDDDDAEIKEGEKGEDDDDVELGADYETGIRFDDDDGYEEADSGAEEATF